MKSTSLNIPIGHHDFQSNRYTVVNDGTGGRIVDGVDQSSDAFPSAEYFMTNDQKSYVDRLNYDHYLYLREIRWLVLDQQTPDNPIFF
jgi:hypothetical protein